MEVVAGEVGPHGLARVVAVELNGYLKTLPAPTRQGPLAHQRQVGGVLLHSEGAGALRGRVFDVGNAFGQLLNYVGVVEHHRQARARGQGQSHPRQGRQARTHGTGLRGAPGHEGHSEGHAQRRAHPHRAVLQKHNQRRAKQKPQPAKPPARGEVPAQAKQRERGQQKGRSHTKPPLRFQKRAQRQRLGVKNNQAAHQRRQQHPHQLPIRQAPRVAAMKSVKAKQRQQHR